MIKLFVRSIQKYDFQSKKSQKKGILSNYETLRSFVWSKIVFPANKCIFNYVPCDNDFELNFAKFLDGAEDVTAFSKIVSRIGFFVEYRDTNGNLRLYYPDFVVKLTNNEHWIIETKGREDIDVELKDKRAKLWCEDATRLTKNKWSFKRINQEDFERYRFRSVQELISTLKEEY